MGSASDDAFARAWVEAWNRRDLAFPGDLGIELLGVYKGVDSIVVLFQARGRKAAEVMEMNADGKVRRAMAHVQAV